MRTTYLKILTGAILFAICLRFGQHFISCSLNKGKACEAKVCESCGGVHHKHHCEQDN